MARTANKESPNLLFADRSDGIGRIIADHHQFHPVRRAVASTVAASCGDDYNAGVIWHTQGSGKSLLMGFYPGQGTDV